MEQAEYPKEASASSQKAITGRKLFLDDIYSSVKRSTSIKLRTRIT